MGSAVVAVVGGFMATRQAKATSRAVPYDQLANRVASLETKAIEWETERASKDRHLFSWDLWWDDLNFHWDCYKIKEAPPNKPIPPFQPREHKHADHTDDPS